MADVLFDVAVANRFISSLSKSLQALCHGCMDFNSGIEIVGYINVNIDSGSKVDYVLNEKVLKSTTNSMTFVSNSFYAKKEQTKHTRDMACSPTPQYTPIPSPHYQRQRGFSHGAYGRSNYHGLMAMRGARKRGFGGEWHGAAKRFRPIPDGANPSGQFSSPAGSQIALNQSFAVTNYGQSNAQESQATDNTSASSISGSGTDGDNSLVNIKNEAMEGDDSAQSNKEDSAQQSNNSDSSQLVAEGMNIKSDPDSVTSGGDGTTNAGETAEADQNDFKGTFLEPKVQDTENDQTSAADTNDQLTLNQQPVSFETPFPNAESPSSRGDETSTENANSVPSTSRATADITDYSEDTNASYNEAVVEYDNAAEDSSQADYHEAGEGSSSGQFEVIEIDDEDEDMQAMFGASRIKSHQPTDTQSTVSRFQQPWNPPVTSLDGPSQSQGHIRNIDTLLRHFEFTSGESLKANMHMIHKKLHVCRICGKGYTSPNGLKSHMALHKGYRVACPLCDSLFTQRSAMRKHMKTFHGSILCSTCNGVYNLGEQFDAHVQFCQKS